MDCYYGHIGERQTQENSRKNDHGGLVINALHKDVFKKARKL